MRLLSSFRVSTRGSAVEKFALGAFLIVAASLTSVNLLSKIASVQGGSKIANADVAKVDDRYAGLGSLGPEVKKGPTFSNVDTNPTASVVLNNARAVVLDPCTGTSK